MRKENLVNWRIVELIDRNDNGISDELEPPVVDVEASAIELRHRLDRNTSTDPHLAAGDVDACWEMAESVGDETAGASSATPDQSVVDEIGDALGITYRDDEELNVGAKERMRDEHRWELDPASADDFLDRMKDNAPHRKPKPRLMH
ncbi:MAG: hypothetical protein HYU52_01175 [Acidobacteria bacterium]|nr:hypothetical protein [Acidobacteriota bacterium]